MNDDRHFWRNLILIALGHLVLIWGLFYVARDRSNSGGGGGENIVFMDPSAFTGQPEDASTPEPTPAPTPEPTPAPTPEPTPEETPLPPKITSEDDLSLQTPTPTPTPTPRPTPKPTPKSTPKPTPKPTPKATPKKTPSPTPKPKPKTSPTPKKTPRPDADADATPRPKPATSATPSKSPSSGSASSNADTPPRAQPVKPGTGTTGSGTSPGQGTGPGTGAGAGPGIDSGLLDDYNNIIQNRFTGAWNQPRAEIQAGSKFVSTVRIVINKDGTVAETSLARSSGNSTVDESVMAAVQSVPRLPAPPTGKTYAVNINFVLGDE